MDDETNVVLFPAEVPRELVRRVRSNANASVYDKEAAIRQIFVLDAASRLRDPNEGIDPERAAAAIAWFAEQVAEQSGEETARAVAGRLQAILEQTTQSAD